MRPGTRDDLDWDVDLDTEIDDELNVTSLTLHLRSLGGRRWSVAHVEAALNKLTRACGDEFQAVGYLEWMATRNAFLWRFLSRSLSDELVKIEVTDAVGPHPPVNWPDMPGREFAVENLTIDDLIASALIADDMYERIVTCNRAQYAKVNHVYIRCDVHDVVLTFQAFCLSHLARTDPAKRPADEDELAASLHSLRTVRAATGEEIETWRRRARETRQMTA